MGFAIAGAILATFQMTTPLFIADAATFALAAAIVVGLGWSALDVRLE